jgi:surface polysaccharide O-acyltransferase-like enzyme
MGYRYFTRKGTGKHNNWWNISFCIYIGLFFHHIFYKNFKYQIFIQKKIKNVLFPYLILSTLAFLVVVIILGDDFFQQAKNLNSFLNYFTLYFKYLWTGKVLTAYWYIPFIMLTFALSPIFLKFIELKKNKQLLTLLTLLFFSMLVHRPEANLSPFHSFIYFTPIYLLGIFFSIHQDKALHFLEGKIILLGIGVVSLALLQIKSHGSYGNYHKMDMFSYHGIDRIIIQKILLIFFIIALLQKFANKQIQVLKYLASLSFPIFFIHPWITFFIKYSAIYEYLLFLPGFVIFIIITTSAVLGSILVAGLIKLIFKKRSSYIIGW